VTRRPAVILTRGRRRVVSRRDRLSPWRASLPRREVLRAAASSRLSPATAIAPKAGSAPGALLARDLGADALVILTDVANVETGFGTDAARPISRTTPAALRALQFPAGSMGPKVEAACRFVEATRKPAMIGQLDDAADLVRGTRGTVVEPVSQTAASRGSA
jgi:carbamate kinase